PDDGDGPGSHGSAASWARGAPRDRSPRTRPARSMSLILTCPPVPVNDQGYRGPAIDSVEFCPETANSPLRLRRFRYPLCVCSPCSRRPAMRRIATLAAVAVIGLLIGADEASDKEDPRKEQDRLQGIWTIGSLIVDGEEVTEAQVGEGRLVVEGDRCPPALGTRTMTS